LEYHEKYDSTGYYWKTFGHGLARLLRAGFLSALLLKISPVKDNSSLQDTMMGTRHQQNRVSEATG
jgi:hypothetical protein